MPSLRQATEQALRFEHDLGSTARDVHTVLVSDDADTVAELTTALDREPGVTVSVEKNPQGAIDRLRTGTRGVRPTTESQSGTYSHDTEAADPVDCVLCDCDTTAIDALDFLELIQETEPALPVILLSDTVSDELAVDALRQGAADVLRKDGDLHYTVLANRIRTIGGRYQTALTMQVFYQAVEHAGHSIYITDPDGVIEYVNPAFETTTGYSADEALGNTPAMLQSGAHDEAFYTTLWETITGGDVWENEIINERKNGERYYADQTIAPLTDSQGTIRYFIAINNEITEAKVRERELEEQNDRLESFASLLSHDLRNPLNVAHGHLDLAEETGDPTHFERVRQAHERMNTLIDDALTLARQGQALTNPDKVVLADVVSAAWNHVATKDATLQCTLAPETTVVADASRLTELFENLFRNAVEHAGSRVTVTVGELSDGTGVFVADDGPGIPEPVRSDVFEPGFTTDDDGTGLGLAITQEVANAHEWEASLGNSDQQGACFRFQIPPDRWQHGGQ